MAKRNKLIADFYELKVNQLMDRRLWDLPIIEENEDISNVFSILSARNHIWVVKNKQDKEIVGAITEHDVLSILAPKYLSPYVFGIPDIKSIFYGTAKTAEDIMTKRVITCSPDEKVKSALDKMFSYKLRRLPVIVDNKLVGELTLSQLIRKYYDATQYNPIVEDEEGR